MISSLETRYVETENVKSVRLIIKCCNFIIMDNVEQGKYGLTPVLKITVPGSRFIRMDGKTFEVIDPVGVIDWNTVTKITINEVK